MQSTHTPEQEGTLHSFSIIHLYTEALKGQSPTPGAKDTITSKMDPIHALQLLVYIHKNNSKGYEENMQNEIT